MSCKLLSEICCWYYKLKTVENTSSSSSMSLQYSCYTVTTFKLTNCSSWLNPFVLLKIANSRQADYEKIRITFPRNFLSRGKSVYLFSKERRQFSEKSSFATSLGKHCDWPVPIALAKSLHQYVYEMLSIYILEIMWQNISWRNIEKSPIFYNIFFDIVRLKSAFSASYLWD